MNDIVRDPHQQNRIKELEEQLNQHRNALREAVLMRALRREYENGAGGSVLRECKLAERRFDELIGFCGDIDNG